MLLVTAALAAIAGSDAFLVDPRLLLPPPPAIGGPAERGEIAQLRHLDRDRTTKEVAVAKADGMTKDGTIFSTVLGPKFRFDQLPKTAVLLNRVRETEKAAAKLGKAEFHRPRPWVRDAELHSCSRTGEQFDSYPSGHATMAFAMAATLARILPDHAAALLARAADYAHSRLVCGQHFPSDIIAGQVLGTVIAADLWSDPTFRAAAVSARSELEGAGLGGAAM